MITSEPLRGGKQSLELLLLLPSIAGPIPDAVADPAVEAFSVAPGVVGGDRANGQPQDIVT